jgi:hypothetical protein
MPFYSILVDEHFAARIMGTCRAIKIPRPWARRWVTWAGGWLYDVYGSYVWRYIGSFGIGLAGVAIALTFGRPAKFLSSCLARASRKGYNLCGARPRIGRSTTVNPTRNEGRAAMRAPKDVGY